MESDSRDVRCDILSCLELNLMELKITFVSNLYVSLKIS
jgi:hypothetical protein